MLVLRALTGPRRAAALAGLEIVAAVAVPTAAVSALQGATPARGLGIVYLLGVLAVAVRRGQAPALVAAALSVVTLNYLFIAPRHRLAIAHSEDVVELVVFLIVAIVVGRLAGRGRQQAAEADRRARVASAREREASLLAGAASAILAGPSMQAQLHTLGRRIARETGATAAEIVFAAAPPERARRFAVRLATRERQAWLSIADDLAWTRADLERISEPLGRLIDVALERERIAAAADEAESASRADAARTAILHSISHDLRSPLTAITTAGAALRSPGLDDGERAELIAVVETEGARLARLVDDLLDLSRIEAGAAAPRADWCDMHDVVGSAVAHLRPEHPVELALPTDLPLVRADAAQLERVFCNLIENAIKFSPPDEPVVVTGGSGGGRVTVRVTDRGKGIPSSQRAYVFEPFFRGRASGGSEGGSEGNSGGDPAGGSRAASAVARPGGSGLGLAICRGFVEANGGRIVLQTGGGRGTSFAVTFPLLEQPAPPLIGLPR